ncbi:MAG: hypothetical protein FWC27_03785 [Firmicutes bacterium]|nr:hypothetical protein [Bacillota bacterium]
MQDWLIWVLATELIVLLLYMMLLRTRQILVILAPVFIAAFFFVMPREMWWIPYTCAGMWLLLLPTARMRAIAVNKYVRWKTMLWMLIPSLPLDAWIVYLFWKWAPDLVVSICVGVLALFLTPFALSMGFLYVICPLFVFHKENCYARQSWQESKSRGRNVTWYVSFWGDDSKYRSGLPFYRWVKRRSGLITYRKHTCLLGVRWISHCG